MARRIWMLVVVLGLVPGMVRAQQGAALEFLDLFAMLDGNTDNVVERGEVPEKGRPAFDRVLKVADTNGAGRLELTEYREALRKARDSAESAGMNRPGGGRLVMQAMDRDGDGKVTREEFRGPAPLFDRLDADKDGAITGEEARQAREGAGGLAGGVGQGAAGMGARLKAMDKNHDGKVSQDEFEGPPVLFNRIDRDQDGFVTEEEARSFRPAGGAALKKAQRKPEPAKEKSDAPEPPAKPEATGK